MRKLKILLVEDNKDAAELLQELLSLLGHEVHLAFDGGQALQLARRTHPHVILSDIGLPGELDGYGLARKLRADPHLSSVYLVALSGFSQDEDRQRTAEAGFDDHLVKPADYEVLVRTLEKVSALSSEVSEENRAP